MTVIPAPVLAMMCRHSSKYRFTVQLGFGSIGKTIHIHGLKISFIVKERRFWPSQEVGEGVLSWG